jgi:aminoglycoside N3'-acetyltransferase
MIAGQLSALGVRAGEVLLVHSAFSRVRPVAGGPSGFVAALRLALGPEGTLVMPSMSDDDDHPFDAAKTPCLADGVVADTFWRMPGVLRSDSPHAFAAVGPEAEAITAPHPLDVPHGLDSPVGRVYLLEGKILLAGVGHDANTTMHLAENLAGVRYGQSKSVTVLREGRRERVAYREVDHCCQKFNVLDQWLDAMGLQRRGRVGSAESRLVRSRDVVETALAFLREEETAFLHPPGACAGCDAARSG